MTEKFGSLERMQNRARQEKFDRSFFPGWKRWLALTLSGCLWLAAVESSKALNFPELYGTLTASDGNGTLTLVLNGTTATGTFVRSSTTTSYYLERGATTYSILPGGVYTLTRFRRTAGGLPPANYAPVFFVFNSLDGGRFWPFDGGYSGVTILSGTLQTTPPDQLTVKLAICDRRIGPGSEVLFSIDGQPYEMGRSISRMSDVKQPFEMTINTLQKNGPLEDVLVEWFLDGEKMAGERTPASFSTHTVNFGTMNLLRHNNCHCPTCTPGQVKASLDSAGSP